MELRKILMIRVLLFILGMTAMATQVILIRESLAIFHGNELIIGLFLGIWMLLTAGGAFLATKLSHVPHSVFRVPFFISTIDHRQSNIDNDSPLLLFSTSILPLASLFLLVILRFSLVPAGVMPGLGQTVLIIFLSLLPFCIVSGMLFPVLVQGLSALKGGNLLHEGYALDSAGSILGGLLFSLVFIFVLPPFESLFILTIFSMIMLIIWFVMIKRRLPAILILLFCISILILNYNYQPARFLDKLQFNKQEVVEIKSSPYGMIAVTRIGDQLFMFENGMPVNIGDDPITREESVHYALLLHKSPEKGLVISGATSGIIEEILKYPVTRIDYVEPDPWLIRVARRYLPFPDDRRINYIFKDPRIFLKTNDEKYDFILINTQEPNSAELNRFYTMEFYGLLKEKLNPGGIISVSIPAAGNYMSETSRQVHSMSYNTLKSIFSHIRIIPGMRDYFLASDSTIEQSIFKDFQSKQIENDYVNPSYINENLLKMRSDLIMKDILPDTLVNSDLKPNVFALFLRQWLERFKIKGWVIPLILLLILMWSLISLGPLNLGLFTGGFTASGLEFILLIWFQVMYGYVYQMTGVIFAVFMAGVVVGSWILGKSTKKYTFKYFLIIQAIFAIFSAIVAGLILLFSSSPLPFFILSLLFINGLLMGLQFTLSARLRKTAVIRSAGESFSADLLGSAVGIILVSIYIIPHIGLPMTAFSLAVLNVIVIVTILYKKRITQ